VAILSSPFANEHWQAMNGGCIGAKLAR